MIVTVTLNPAVDQTLFVQSVALGAVNRVRDSQLDPGGKGINVSRVVHRLQWPTIALGFMAGDIGHLAQRTLVTEGVQSDFLHIPGETRLNVTIVDETAGTGTSFYDKGPEVGPTDPADFEMHIRKWLRAASVLVIAGSLPPGLPDDTYASYVRLARSAGVKTILDAHEEPLLLGIEAGPYLIKPNVSEAEELLGRPLPNLASVVKAAKEIAAGGVQVAVISMGAHGSVCAQGRKVLHAVPPKIERRSTVGSGDSMVAGLAVALAQGADIVEGLRLGTAAGAATAMTLGTELGSLAEIQALLPKVVVEELS